MRALEHMKRVLENMGLYELTGDSAVEWELAAYDAGFSLLEERFDRLLGDLFVDTASRERIAQWEVLFRDQPAQTNLEDCRESVRQRLSVHPGCFTPQAVKAVLPAAGVRGLLLEEEKKLVVLLGRLMGINQNEANLELDRLLPSHIPWSWDDSVTWVALNAYPATFQDWDGLGRTWQELDQITREDLEASFKN
jgi:hypothetical protein